MTSFTVDTTHRSALHSIREREHKNEIFRGLHGGKNDVQWLDRLFNTLCQLTWKLSLSREN